VLPSSPTARGGFGAFGEGGDLLENAILEDAEVGGLEAVHIVAFAIGHLKAEHHHIDLDTEDGALSVLRLKHGAGRSHSKKSSSRNRRHDRFPGSVFCLL
jgi:hypothetical protein